MHAFKNILVPTDFGEPAEEAVELAIAFAQKFDARLTLLHAYEILTYPYGDAPDWVDDLARAEKTALDTALGDVKERYPRATGVLRTGTPWEQILFAAKEHATDLIVMGTHGRRGLSRVFLGSVAEKVVRLAPVPVLTVGARGGSDDATRSP